MKVWAVISYSTKNNVIAIEGIFTTRQKAIEVAKIEKDFCHDYPGKCRRIVKVKSVIIDNKEPVYVT